jgi:translation initiation factor 4E
LVGGSDDERYDSDEEGNAVFEPIVIEKEIKERIHTPRLNEKFALKWTFWHQGHFERGKNLNKTDYLRELKKGGNVDSLSSFWNQWNKVQNRRSEDCNYHLFKQGIKPIWEDPKNFKGGKCVIVAPKTSQDEMIAQWVNLTLALMDEEIQAEVNGVVLSTRAWGNIYSVWVRDARDRKAVSLITEKLQEVFGAIPVKFQRHQTSIKKKSKGNESSGSSGSPSEDERAAPAARSKSVVTEKTKGMLHQLIAEVTEAPVCPPTSERKDIGKEKTQETPPSPGIPQARIHRQPVKPSPLPPPPIEEKTFRKQPPMHVPVEVRPRRQQQAPTHHGEQIVRATPKKDHLVDLDITKLGTVLAVGAVISLISWIFF